MTEVSRMDYGPRARMQPIVEVQKLAPEARYRLISQLGRTTPDEYTPIVEAANGLVVDVLAGLRDATRGRQPGGDVSETLTHKNSNNLMAAIHALNISGYYVDYGPNMNGQRVVSCEDQKLLSSVKGVFDTSAARLAERFGTSTASIMMDEATATVYEVLRSERDGRYKEENERKHRLDQERRDREQRRASVAGNNGHGEVVVYSGLEINGPIPDSALALASR
jgi:hypothetical protein